MEDGDGVCAMSQPQWQPETLDSTARTVVWKLQKSLYVLRSAPKGCQQHLECIPTKAGFVPNPLDKLSLDTLRNTKRTFAHHFDDDAWNLPNI